VSESLLWSGRSVHTSRQSAGMDQRRHQRLGFVPARVCGTPSAAARPRYRAAADHALRLSYMIWLIGRLISGNSDGANDGGGDKPSGASASGDIRVTKIRGSADDSPFRHRQDICYRCGRGDGVLLSRALRFGLPRKRLRCHRQVTRLVRLRVGSSCIWPVQFQMLRWTKLLRAS
jgi:hypothetical protein